MTPKAVNATICATARCLILAALALAFSGCVSHAVIFTGRLQHSARRPVANAAVEAVSAPKFSPFGPSMRIHPATTTGVDGSFTLTVPTEHSEQLWFRAPGIFEAVPAGTPTTPLLVTVGQTKLFSTVTDGQGRFVRNQWITTSKAQ